jgi:hypothetical protein
MTRSDPRPASHSSRGADKLFVNLRHLANVGEVARVAIVTTIKEGLAEVASAAELGLVISRRDAALPPEGNRHKTWVWIELSFDKDPPAEDSCAMAVAECGTGSISVSRHRQLSVCGTDQGTRKKRFLTSDWLLGKALGNSGLHEIGHLIGDFQDNRLAGHIMSSTGPAREARTIKSQQDFWAGRLIWSPEEKAVLIRNLKRRVFDGGMTIETP